jgi:hypothetical protein
MITLTNTIRDSQSIISKSSIPYIYRVPQLDLTKQLNRGSTSPDSKLPAFMEVILKALEVDDIEHL